MVFISVLQDSCERRGIRVDVKGSSVMWPASLKKMREKRVELSGSWGSKNYAQRTQRSARSNALHGPEHAGLFDENLGRLALL